MKDDVIKIIVGAKPPLILDPTKPMGSARKIIEVNYTDEAGRLTLRRHRGAFWQYNGSCYRLIDEDELRSGIWCTLEAARSVKESGTAASFNPTIARVSNILEALKGAAQLDGGIEPPAWLAASPGREELFPAEEILPCANGLLHLPTGELIAPTPDYFCLAASPVAYDPAAPEPAQWLGFLKQVLGDADAIGALQDWFGYTLSADTRQQKILLCVGPRRSGKGTVARVHTGLLGANSVVGPTMSSLGETFGLEPLITAALAIVSDARIGGRTDKSMIVERLLALSGEDLMSVHRKFLRAWTGRLRTRIAVLTNELPALTEGSGALVGRLIVILFPDSFYGREDTGLTDKLLSERPGILSWAIEGYRQLRKRGCFEQPKNAVEVLKSIEMLGAPVKAFVRDRCEVDAGNNVEVDALFGAWRIWCETEGRMDSGSREWFGRNLRSAFPGIRVTQPRTDGGGRTRIYEGIGFLKEEAAPKEDEIPF